MQSQDVSFGPDPKRLILLCLRRVRYDVESTRSHSRIPDTRSSRFQPVHYFGRLMSDTLANSYHLFSRKQKTSVHDVSIRHITNDQSRLKRAVPGKKIIWNFLCAENLTLVNTQLTDVKTHVKLPNQTTTTETKMTYPSP